MKKSTRDLQRTGFLGLPHRLVGGLKDYISLRGGGGEPKPLRVSKRYQGGGN